MFVPVAKLPALELAQVKASPACKFAFEANIDYEYDQMDSNIQQDYSYVEDANNIARLGLRHVVSE